jgi:hypothetical protein
MTLCQPVAAALVTKPAPASPHFQAAKFPLRSPITRPQRPAGLVREMNSWLPVGTLGTFTQRAIVCWALLLGMLVVPNET